MRNETRSLDTAAVRLWCVCGKRSIAAPPGATLRTRYTCPECCDRESRGRLPNDGESEWPTLAETRLVLSLLCHGN